MRTAVVFVAFLAVTSFAAKLRQAPEMEAVPADSAVASDTIGNFGSETSNLIDASASVQTSWECMNFDGNWNPIVFDPATRDIACAAPNGRDCLWTKSSAECSGVIGVWSSNAPLLRCGADHKAKYGETGYSNPNHWCAKALRQYWRCPSEFGQATAIGRNPNTNEIHCVGDGANCNWSMNDASCLDFLSKYDGSKVNFLNCGGQHLSLYGGTGYDSKGHWCARGQNLISRVQIIDHQ
eukprot:TRINITY_DN25_c0_g1_i1.p2 TRINITY_DN25_c0_g1~~TRINITY_DN25_c0_g1_i1.p2  ORF type:complete len:238 (-),score=99.66 TRINITY_DN25_c0_g1_i1:83-796(-)